MIFLQILRRITRRIDDSNWVFVEDWPRDVQFQWKHWNTDGDVTALIILKLVFTERVTILTLSVLIALTISALVFTGTVIILTLAITGCTDCTDIRVHWDTDLTVVSSHRLYQSVHRSWLYLWLPTKEVEWIYLCRQNSIHLGNL